MRMGMFLTHGGGPCSPLPLLLVLCLFVGGGFGYAVYGEEPRNSNDAMQFEIDSLQERYYQISQAPMTRRESGLLPLLENCIALNEDALATKDTMCSAFKSARMEGDSNWYQGSGEKITQEEYRDGQMKLLGIISKCRMLFDAEWDQYFEDLQERMTNND